MKTPHSTAEYNKVTGDMLVEQLQQQIREHNTQQHEDTPSTNDITAQLRQQIYETTIAAMATATGISVQVIAEPKQLVEVWQHRLVQLAELGFDEAQREDMLRSFAEIWFAEALFDSTSR